MAQNRFRDLELLNVKIDVWIDDEEYDQIFQDINVNNENVIKGLVKEFIQPPDHKKKEKEPSEDKNKEKDTDNETKHIENFSKKNIHKDWQKTLSDYPKKEDIIFWKRLFITKYLRAKIMQNGEDKITKLLDDLVVYLQRKLPYPSTKDDDEQTILQHIYFEELSACGKPGLESLGFAVRAEEIIKDREKEIKEREKTNKKSKNKKTAEHFSFELYKLWAKFNQGIGYYHSKQKMAAANAFNEVIRKFNDSAKILQSNEKLLWRSLLHDQAVLFRAELQEDLQFSYHTIDTLKRLNENNVDGPRKEENRLIKEAIAFRDMGRLEESRKKIGKLLAKEEDFNNIHEKKEIINKFCDNLTKKRLDEAEKNLKKLQDKIKDKDEREKIEEIIGLIKERSESIDIHVIKKLVINLSETEIAKIFVSFQEWGKERNKKNLMSKMLGLLFDYSFSKIESLKFNEINEADKNEIGFLSNEFIAYLKNDNADKINILKVKSERTSFYLNVAKFLEWLAKGFKKTNDEFFKNQITELYWGTRDRNGLKKYLFPKDKKDPESVNLEEFDKYLYDRFIGSLGKFFEIMSEKDPRYIKYEAYFLSELNEHEKKRNILFEFREHERNKRIEYLYNGVTRDVCCACFSKCFENPKKSEEFSEILECSMKRDKEKDRGLLAYFDVHLGPLTAHEYEYIMEKENDRFLDYLKHKSRHPILSLKPGKNKQKTFHFMGLQRWNSQTPTLTLSQGGGYLLYEQDQEGAVTLGIAIDPGFDFVDNLFNMGFTLNDIDFILLSHAHLDHIRDFEPIVSSLLDLRKRDKKSNKRIHVMMTLGVYDKLEKIITNPTLREFLADTYIIDIDKQIEPNYLKEFKFGVQKESNESSKKRREFVSIIEKEEDKNIKRDDIRIGIKATLAYHNDYTEISDSYGFIINLYEGKNEEKPKFSFGYTGDTKWDKEIPIQYKVCDAVCIHLGALIRSEKEKWNKFEYYKGPKCEELIREKQHPYLFGLLRYLKEISKIKNQNRLLLVSEFGEELKGGIRIDLIRRLNQLLKGQRICLPVDIGLNIILAKKNVGDKNENKNYYAINEPFQGWCCGCLNYINVKDIRYRHYGFGNDEALFYFCKACLKSLPENVIQEKMRLICEKGLPLQKAFEHDNK